MEDQRWKIETKRNRDRGYGDLGSDGVRGEGRSRPTLTQVIGIS